MVAAVPGSHSAEVCLLDAFEGAMIRLRPGSGSHLLSPTSHLAGLPRLEAQGGISGHQIGGSYLRYTGRDDHGGATAAHDSQPTFCVSTRTCFNYKFFACHRPICSKEPTSLLAVSTRAVHVTPTVRSRQARHKLANLSHGGHKRSRCHRVWWNRVSRPPRRSSSPRSQVFRSDCIKASGPGS